MSANEDITNGLYNKVTDKEVYWDVFSETGEVFAYLMYKDTEKSGKTEVLEKSYENAKTNEAMQGGCEDLERVF